MIPKLYLTIIASILLMHHLNAQHVPNAATNPDYYNKVKYIADAPIMLPKLYNEKKFDEIQNYTNNWNISNAPSFELIYVLNTLLAIQGNKLDIHRQPTNIFHLMENYAKECMEINENGYPFKYYIYVDNKQKYDATDDAIAIITFLKSWSTELLASKKMSNSETYLCNVFAGKIDNPKDYFTEYSSSLPEIKNFTDSIETIQNNCFIKRRNESRLAANLYTGIWIPQKNVQTIAGSDFYFGFQTGWRNRKNEVDFSVGFCCPKTTLKTYTFFATNDTLYNSNYYYALNYCLDYTRYFIHRTKLDIGYTGGIGYNDIDAEDGKGQYRFIGTFTVEAGMQAKYYIGRGPCIGIQTLYHVLNYCNTGGTDLTGNAFSIALYIGTK